MTNLEHISQIKKYYALGMEKYLFLIKTKNNSLPMVHDKLKQQGSRKCESSVAYVKYTQTHLLSFHCVWRDVGVQIGGLGMILPVWDWISELGI